MTEQTMRGRLTEADREAYPVRQLPFDVPPGTSRIDVTYSFEGGNSILDLGLADPRFGAFPATDGFRGWSGSARRSVHVSAWDATPGYLAGDLQPGRWHVLLGLARVADCGCSYSVTVRTTRDGHQPAADLAAASPTRATAAFPAREWLAGDLQSHTHHSDARGTVAEIARAARECGLSFLAVTDHNTISHHVELAEHTGRDLVMIPGTEVTTYRGHANVWGVNGFVDFRITGDADVDALVRQVRERGGLFSVNHPKATPDCIGCDWELEVPSAADAFEAWQGPWVARNWESLERYDEQLRSGRRPTLVGGSDRHQPPLPDRDPWFLQVGSPTTWLRAGRSVASLLAAIRSGEAFVSERPTGPRLVISADGVPMGGRVRRASGRTALRAQVDGAAGDRLAWVSARGVVREVRIPSDSYSDAFEWKIAGPFVRAEVRADESIGRLRQEFASLLSAAQLEEATRRPWRRALSNPVHFGA